MATSSPERAIPSIAILGSRGIPARYGGFERFAEEISVRLAARGVEIAVYAEGESDSRERTYRGVRIIPIRPVRCGPLSTIIFDLRCLIHASRRYSVIYMLGYGAAIFFPFVRCPLWVNMDGLEWSRAKWRWAGRTWLRVMEGIALRFARLVICDAEAIETSLRKRHGDSFRANYVPYGATIEKGQPDDAVLAHFGLTAGGYHLVVCRIEPENHVLEILQGFLSCRANSSLVIVGDVATANRYHRQVARFASERIRFLGAVYDASVLRALRFHCAAYCHGHSVGGTNPSLLEAMASGNIVVAHDNVFNREVCGEDGLYWRTFVDLGARLLEAESMNQPNREALGTRMRARVSERYDWEKVVDRYVAFLREEIERSVRAGASA
ncbi:MAG TPA: DUF1972 domain-containing protein [Aestuariivirgaceae bacterium]|jgi:glycosyltransferase involved in cell wall biosynthesis